MTDMITERRLGRLEAFVKAILVFLEDREDIDDNGNANEAMQLLIDLKELGVLNEPHSGKAG